MKEIILEEVVAPGCHICKAFEDFWNTVKADFSNVKFEKIDVTSPKGLEMVQKYMIFASPGIIINNELFSTGGFNKEKFIAKLKELS